MENSENSLSPEAQENFGKTLEDVFSHILERAEKERQETEPWKSLFEASDQGLISLLSEANSQMLKVVFNTVSIIEKNYSIRCSPKLYALIKALPFIMNNLTDQIKDQQGLSCCADKARKIYCDEVLAEISYLLLKGDNKGDN